MIGKHTYDASLQMFVQQPRSINVGGCVSCAGLPSVDCSSTGRSVRATALSLA
jgi:hypothetical protein